jgi:hypothetical protein
MSRCYFTIAFTLLLAFAVHAQAPKETGSVLLEKVTPVPAHVFKMFRKTDVGLVNHPLTPAESAKVKAAFEALPALHQKILGTHLRSISFMDNMPNTGLTSPVVRKDSIKMFDIIFRAGMLHETISEWATKKENTLFDRSENSDYRVTIEAGTLDALVFTLLHEATHVVDAVLEITPHPDDAAALVEPTPYTRDIWHKMNKPVGKYIDPVLEKTLFRGGSRVSIDSAPEIYGALAKLPFVSMYATASWFEDIAELETIYHLTHKMKQPFSVVVKKDNVELVRFEPMKNKLVKKRLRQLKSFYA